MPIIAVHREKDKPKPLTVAAIASMSPADKLGEAIRRSMPLLSPDVRDEVMGMLSGTSLANKPFELRVWPVGRQGRVRRLRSRWRAR